MGIKDSIILTTLLGPDLNFVGEGLDPTDSELVLDASKKE